MIYDSILIIEKEIILFLTTTTITIEFICSTLGNLITLVITIFYHLEFQAKVENGNVM